MLNSLCVLGIRLEGRGRAGKMQETGSLRKELFCDLDKLIRCCWKTGCFENKGEGDFEYGSSKTVNTRPVLNLEKLLA